MYLRPMVEFARQLHGGTGHWLKILREEMTLVQAYGAAWEFDLERPELPVYASVQWFDLAGLEGLVGEGLEPFLPSADGERELLHVKSDRFEAWVNATEAPLRLMRVRPGPMLLYRGDPVADVELEWPALPNDPGASALRAGEYVFTAADEWASAFAARGLLGKKVGPLPRSKAWTALVSAAGPDLGALLGAWIRVKDARVAFRGPEPLISEMARLAASERELLGRLPTDRQDEGRQAWLRISTPAPVAPVWQGFSAAVRERIGLVGDGVLGAVDEQGFGRAIYPFLDRGERLEAVAAVMAKAEGDELSVWKMVYELRAQERYRGYEKGPGPRVRLHEFLQGAARKMLDQLYEQEDEEIRMGQMGY